MKKKNVSFMVCSLAILAVLVSVAMNHAIALGQLPFPTTPSATQPLPNGVERRGSLESTGVRLDGQELFRIASPAVANRAEPGDQIPVEVRATQIEANLALITGRLSNEPLLDPKTLEVVVENVNRQPVLFVKDATLADAKVLLTVTDADAQYASTSKDRLAAQWQEILKSELREAIELRQPKAVQQQVSTVVRVLVATGLLTVILGASWAFFGQRNQRLQQRLAAESALIRAQELHTPELYTPEQAPMKPLEAESELLLFQKVRHHFGLERRLQIVRFLRWLLFWAIAFIWVVGVAYSLNAFLQTRNLPKK